MIRKNYIIVLAIFFAACSQQTGTKTSPAESKTITNDTIPSERKNINKAPVASYILPMGDKKLDWKFGVQVFETKETFKYRLVMFYEGMIETDTLKLPNFGKSPVVQVKPGTGLSCVIGFLDTHNNFREYKLLAAKNDHLSLTTLKKYAVATYSK